MVDDQKNKKSDDEKQKEVESQKQKEAEADVKKQKETTEKKKPDEDKKEDKQLEKEKKKSKKDSKVRLSRGYTCDFLLQLATWHPQSCSATEVKGGCTCSQMSLISATCCKKLNSMNILQHCPSDFVAEPVSGYTCDIVVSQFLQHQEEVLYCQCK